MSSPNHFELLDAEELSVEIALRNYGWMGRKQFCLFLTGLLLMQFLCVTALGGAQSLTAVVLIVGVCALLLLALQLLVSALRLQHIGYGGAWVWVLLVSALNAVILLQCITAPKGYHQHSKYDTGGLIGFGNRCSAQCLWQDCWRCEAMVDRESLVYQSRNWQNVGL